MCTEFTRFMEDLEQRFKLATGLPDRSQYKIFYAQVRPASVLTLGINPGALHPSFFERAKSRGCAGKGPGSQANCFRGRTRDAAGPRPLLRERLYLISKATDPSAKSGPISLKASLALPLLLSSPAQGLRRIVEQAARDNGLPRPNVIAEMNSMSILRLALLAGIGNGILPSMAVKQELDLGLLHGRPISQPQLARTVNVCASKSRPLTPATLAVQQLIVRVARGLSASEAWVESVAL